MEGQTAATGWAVLSAFVRSNVTYHWLGSTAWIRSSCKHQDVLRKSKQLGVLDASLFQNRDVRVRFLP
jgi:hypothetical protein